MSCLRNYRYYEALIFISEQTEGRYVIFSSKKTLQRLRDGSLDSITAGGSLLAEDIVMAVEQLFGGRGVLAADFAGVTICFSRERSECNERIT